MIHELLGLGFVFALGCGWWQWLKFDARRVNAKQTRSMFRGVYDERPGNGWH